MQAVELGSMSARAREQQREMERLAAEKANAPVEAVTGFLVYIMPDGSINMSADLNIPLTVTRPPHADEVRAACAVIPVDMANQETAMFIVQNTVANVLMNLGRMTQAQAEQQAAEREMKTSQPGGQVPAGFRRG